MEKSRLHDRDDDALMDLAVGASEEAIPAKVELLQRHTDRVYAWCFRQLGRRDAALDCARSILLEAARELTGTGGSADPPAAPVSDGDRPPAAAAPLAHAPAAASGAQGPPQPSPALARTSGTFGAWLFARTRRRLHATLRVPSLLIDDEEPQWHVVEARGDRGAPWGTDGEPTAALGPMAQALSAVEQDALALRCLERFPVDEVGRVLALPGGREAVQTLLATARTKLRAALEAPPATDASAPRLEAGKACVLPEQLAQVHALEAHAPRRHHLQACPRCRALARSWAAFVAAPAPLPASAHGSEARKELLTAIRLRLHDEPVRWGAGPRSSRQRRDAARATRILRIALWSSGGMLALVVGTLGAMALLQRHADRRAGGVVVWGEGARRRGARSGGDPEAAERAQLRNAYARHTGFAIVPVAAGSDGRWTLSWSAVDGADTYQVRFFTKDFEPITSTSPVAVRSLTVLRDQLGSVAATDSVVLWQVLALRAGDVVSNSRVGRIALR